MTMYLAHIEDKTPEETTSQPITLVSTDLRYNKCVSMEAWIRSRCCGLVEVLHENHWSSDPAVQKKRTINSRISLLHRTVAEFLWIASVWERLKKLTEMQGFDVNLSLVGAYGDEDTSFERDC